MTRAYAQPLLYRNPTTQLTRAREDHATCLLLAADYRAQVVGGNPFMRERHAWAVGHARILRKRFPGLLSEPSPAAVT